MADETTNENANGNATTRDQIRAQILGTPRYFESRTITFFGTEIEIRQPSMGVMLDARQAENPRKGLMQMLLMYAFVPGTDEKVFERQDEDVLMSLPAHSDFFKLSNAIAEMTDIAVMKEEEAKN